MAFKPIRKEDEEKESTAINLKLFGEKAVDLKAIAAENNLAVTHLAMQMIEHCIKEYKETEKKA